MERDTKCKRHQSFTKRKKEVNICSLLCEEKRKWGDDTEKIMCLISFFFFPSKKVRRTDAISITNTSEKEVRFKSRVGKEQPWEHVGMWDSTGRGKVVMLPYNIAKLLIPE